MHTYSTQRVVAGDPSCLPAVIDEVVARLWGARASLLADGQGTRTYAVLPAEGDTGPDVWLSFLATPSGHLIQVRLTLDELDAGPDPTEALDEVLDLLAASLAGQPASGD